MNLTDVDKKFDAEYEEKKGFMATALEAQKLVEFAMNAASDTRWTYRPMATTIHEAAVALNEGLGCIHLVLMATATAASSMAIGTADPPIPQGSSSAPREHARHWVRRAEYVHCGKLHVNWNWGSYRKRTRRFATIPGLVDNTLQ